MDLVTAAQHAMKKKPTRTPLAAISLSSSCLRNVKKTLRTPNHWSWDWARMLCNEPHPPTHTRLSVTAPAQAITRQRNNADSANNMEDGENGSSGNRDGESASNEVAGEVEPGAPSLPGYLPWEQDLQMVSTFLDKKVPC